MKKLLLLAIMSLTCISYAGSGEAYLKRFTTYWQWSQNLPLQPDADFIAFIDSDTPLAQKLREKWLYQLARQKDWVNFLKHYKNSPDVNLQCLAQLANYNQGKTIEALNAAKLFWLLGHSQPQACNTLFSLLFKSNLFDEHLINQRIILALDKQNISLARFLLKQYKPPRLKDEQLLASIHQRPTKISQLERGDLHDYFYLYGLKLIVAIDIDQAIKHWRDPRTKRILNEAQQQSFLGHLALYKAMRNHDDTPRWFAKIKPIFYNEALIDWQIRFALKRQNWQQVEYLITHSTDKDKPCWQYWLARALEFRGEKIKANELYQIVAKSRHYYGFLASLRLHISPSFENENPVSNLSLLKPYQRFIDNIKWLYNSKQTLQASRLLNDFIIELPKEEKSALIYWLANVLHWHDKSVYLSNTDELNNQLALRFPLVYQATIQQYSNNYQVAQEFIYAIIRQESGYRDNVVSPAGARGLMQIMPYTALVVAKLEKIAYLDKKQLFLSSKNINIGVAYLKQLARRYNRHPILIAAAYNAGPSQVNYWLRNHPPKEIDIWIDTLPWHETRNYLKNIIAFYTVYQYRLRHKPDLLAVMKTLS